MIHHACRPRPGHGSDSVRAYLPDTLNLDCLPAKWLDYGRWVVGRVYLEQHLRPEAHRDDYVHLWSAVLKQVLPSRDYRRILDGVVGPRILEEDSTYRRSTAARKGHSKSFRVSPILRYRPYESVWLTHPPLVAKLAARARREEEQVTASVHRHLRTMLSHLHLADGSPTVSLPLTTIAHKEWRFSVCRQGRVYTNLTSLPTGLRAHLRFDGQPLWQLDIVNSQPFFMGLALRDAGRLETDENFRSYKGHLLTNKTPTPIPISSPASLPYVATSNCQNVPICAGDIDDYIGLCRDGGIYERLMNLAGFAPTKENRDMVKRLFFAVAYGEVRDGDTRVGRAFQAAFPNCWASVCKLKNGARGGLARWMQTVESWTLIWRVGQRILAEYPEAPLLTIHDSIVTTEKFVVPFRQVMEYEFQKVWGVVPQFKAKAFANDGV